MTEKAFALQLSRLSVFIQAAVVLILFLFFFTGWYLTKRPVLKTWSFAWFFDLLGLVSVFLVTFFNFTSSEGHLLYFLYSIFKLLFLLLIILGIYRILGIFFYRRARKFLLAFSLLSILAFVLTLTSTSPAHLQGAVDLAVGILSLIAGMRLLPRRSGYFPVKAVALALMLYGVAFLHHGIYILPLYWGGKIPEYLSHISFFDALVELALGMTIFVSNQVEILRELRAINSRLEESRKKLRGLVEVDPLTGAYNRRKLREYADSLEEGFVIFIDIDGFKDINDRWGHSVGDLYLVRVADSLKKVFREEGIFRIGGDEFLVVFSGADRKMLEERIERFRKILNERSWLPVSVSVSVGIAPFGRENTFSEALHVADKLMYGEKRKK